MKNKAIRQREKDMKILWGELTRTSLNKQKESLKKKRDEEKQENLEDVRDVRYNFL